MTLGEACCATNRGGLLCTTNERLIELSVSRRWCVPVGLLLASYKRDIMKEPDIHGIISTLAPGGEVYHNNVEHAETVGAMLVKIQR
jgi:hypothetical protein